MVNVHTLNIFLHFFLQIIVEIYVYGLTAKLFSIVAIENKFVLYLLYVSVFAELCLT